jgi:predicted RecB family nuclease
MGKESKSKPYWLTKSTFMRGVQCPKYLYLGDREKVPAPSPDDQFRMDLGKKAGEYARGYFPGGILVDHPSVEERLLQTENAIKSGALIIYEATFIHEGIQVKVDILKRQTEKSPWEIWEAKGFTNQKSHEEEYLPDIAIQTWVLKNQKGLEYKSSNLIYLDREATTDNPPELFTSLDVTKEIKPLLSEMPALITKMKEVLESKKPPEIKISSHCNSPRACPFKEQCWSHIPEPSILDLFGRGNKSNLWKQLNQNILSLEDPRAKGSTKLHDTVLEVERTGKPFVAKALIQDIIKKSWKYPLYFLDFETFTDSVPMFEGMYPWEQVPFQFSVHKLEENGTVTHEEFLFDKAGNPREQLAKALIKACGPKGTIFSWSNFEEQRIKGLMETCSNHSGELQGLLDRLFDLLDIFCDGMINYKEFKRSFSIKSVAPALLGQKFSYEDMEIGNGVDAQIAYVELISKLTSAERKEAIKKNLKIYCKHDTEAMLELVKWVREMVKI